MAEDFIIWGANGGCNLGDEAILWAVSRLLRRLRPKARQSVIVQQELSTKTAELYARWDLVVVRAGSFSCLNALRSARLIVGGGQLVDDKTLGWPVGWTSLFLLANRMLGQKPLILCIGAERISRRLTVGLVKYVYSLAAVCGCRDAESAAVLRAAGVPAAKVWCANDMVFSLERTLLPARHASSTNPCQIAVVIARDSDRHPDIIGRLHLLVAALLRSGFQIQLVAHDVRMEYDKGALLLFAERYRDEPRVTWDQLETVEQVLELYSHCDAVISSRMHPLILASLVGSLPIAIVCTEKVKALAVNFEIPALAFEQDPETQISQIKEILGKREEYTRAMGKRSMEFGKTVEEMTERALIQ